MCIRPRKILREKIERFKARFVAKGFTQKERIDCNEKISLIYSKESFRIIMPLVEIFDLELHQIDVKTTFLNGDLGDKVYIV